MAASNKPKAVKAKPAVKSARKPAKAKTAEAPKRPRGNQTKYTDALATEILVRMAGGLTVNQVCRQLETEGTKIAPSTVRLWVLDNRQGFAERYARAREMTLEFWADECVDIADDGTNDWVERKSKEGETFTVVDHEHISRSKVRIDTRKWLLSKLKPDRYGDKLQVGGDADKPIYSEVVFRCVE